MLTSLPSPDLYRALLESMTEGVSLSDEAGTIVYTNRAEDALFGYAPGELIGQHVSVQNAYPMQENERRVEQVIAHLKVHGHWEGEWLNRRKDGATFVTASRITAVEVRGRPHWLCVQRDVAPARAAEAQLRESEQRLRLAARAAAIGTWDMDLTSGRGAWDDMALAIGGMRDRNYTHESWTALVHPEDRERVAAAFQASLAPGGPAYHVEFRGAVPAEDGDVRWLASHGSVLRDPVTGIPQRAIGIVRDITADRRATAALQDSEARFRALVDAAPSFVWFAAPDGRLEWFNDRWYEFTGQTPDEALPDGWAATLHPDDADRTRREWEGARARGVGYTNECRYRRRDGAYRWHVARAEPIRDGDGRIVRWCGTSTDIHDQKQAVERLELALDAGAIQGTWVWDVPADKVTADERFAHTFGIDLEACRSGFPIARAVDGIHPDDRDAVNAAIAGALASGGAYRSEYRARNADGEYRWIEASGRVELAADGSPLRFPGVAVDVAARREAEERERLLAREVDHRAKNLLGVIQSVVQLTRGDSVDALKAAVAGRIQALARAHSLLAAGRWEGVELGALVQEELAPFAQSNGARIRIDGGALRLRPGASQALALAIHELATNAAKYGALSSDRGAVEIRWRVRSPGDGTAALDLLWVEEGGPTIAEPPAQTGFGSTVLAASIKRQLGGTLEMDWRRTGLVCRMIVPADQIAEPAPPDADQVQAEQLDVSPTSLDGWRILVVEDEAMIALQIQAVVEELGAEVIGPAATVADALAWLRAETPDCAILDVNLAGERSDRVAQALAALEVPFIQCTGYGDSAGMADGAAERVAKPIDPALLAGALARLPNGPRPQSATPIADSTAFT